MTRSTFGKQGISIHAPARGATVLAIQEFFHDFYFNPRSREGSDDKVAQSNDISSDFNPRSREGSDASFLMASASARKFQSTLPRGERRKSLGMTLDNFGISIHAPARGATWVYVR